MNKEPLEYYQNLYYTIIITKQEFENEAWYDAHCKELGKYSCYGTGKTPIKALKEFLNDKNDFIEVLYKEKIKIPSPKEGLLQEDKWISVEDELPKDNNNDEDREFIVEIEIKHSCVYPVTSAQWDRKEQRFYKGIEYLKVVRWQNFPKPPITKKRGGCNP